MLVELRTLLAVRKGDEVYSLRNRLNALQQQTQLQMLHAMMFVYPARNNAYTRLIFLLTMFYRAAVSSAQMGQEELATQSTDNLPWHPRNFSKIG